VFDHVGIHVRDLQASKRFYTAVLRPLGVVLTHDSSEFIEFGALSIGKRQPPTPPIHFAFIAARPEAVDAFHRKGVKEGYRDNGAPAFRPQYADDYYAAYLIDPDGHNVEAVNRSPATRARWDWLRIGLVE
jgi:catechol 2,3-dioxygenase-like lactoylglutathione lyase family enzyme